MTLLMEHNSTHSLEDSVESNNMNYTMSWDEDQHIYEGFDFEHPIYLYIWEILVIISSLIGILFMLTLLRKKLRSATSSILCAIAISDSLTGLVTLPTYIMVYLQLQTADDVDYDYGYGYEDYYQNYTSDQVGPPINKAYVISKQLCEAFMISKFFLSKMFHTISIWLTVFLGLQRCLSVLLPFSAPAWFSKTRTLIICIVIAVLSPALHVFHLFHDKTVNGFCVWTLEADCSGGSCIQLWVVLILRHLTPCVVLTVTTVVMVRNLLKSSFQKSRCESVKKFKRGSEVVEDENRLVSKIVTAIVIVFLLTEVPYGLFLLYLSVASKEMLPTLETNRAIHVVYELTMVLSFNANFCIYNGFNRRFRVELRRLFSCCPCFKNKKGSSQPVPSQSQSSSSQNHPQTEMSTMN